ncbi:MAG: hypothetical protein KJ749_12905 [Planctomycetes bacterium]|nr:hypothetical protein [Planctomycetota bacterium]
MAVDSTVFKRLVAAITPVVSIGVGSAAVSVCTRTRLNRDRLEVTDVPGVKDDPLARYERFRAQKVGDIRAAWSYL